MPTAPPRERLARRPIRLEEGKNAPMRRLLASGLALALAVLAVTTLARTPEAQTNDRVLEACAPGKEAIDARALPATVAPERCPVGGREIKDGPVATAVPAPGEGVYAEALATGGAQELAVRRREDGAIELGLVGEETGEAGEALRSAATRGPSAECRDTAYQSSGWRVVESLGYRINHDSVPQKLSRVAAEAAIRRAGGNVTDTHNICKMGDRVPAVLNYNGDSEAQAIGPEGCVGYDETNVVSFGDLESGILARTCTYFEGEAGFDRVTGSDIQVNKADFRWTTRPNARSCKRSYDLEAVLTHERGHTFGLGHIMEMDHRYMTMSTFINGPCQSSERSLGRGDVLGLDRKYDG